MDIGVGQQANIDWLYYVRSGRAFEGYGNAGAVAAQNALVQLFNPVGSGVTVIIRAAQVYSSTAQSPAKTRFNTAFATNQSFVINFLNGGAAPKAQTRTLNQAGNNGSATGTFTILASTTFQVWPDWADVLAAGQGAHLYAPVVNTDLAVNFQWVEF